MQPRVSILLPAHKTNIFIFEAIESIMNQTYSNLELIILDNSILGLDFEDFEINPRIKILKTDSRMGLSEVLNYGIKQTNSVYLARMDYDDVSVPERIAKQVEFLEKNRDVGIVGGFVRYIGKEYDSKSIPNSIVTRPANHYDLLEFMLTKNPLFHPTVMFRRSELIRMKSHYSQRYDGCEDLELWSRAVRITKIANIPEVLLEYRTHDDQFSRLAGAETNYLANVVKFKYAFWCLLHRPKLRLKALRTIVRTVQRFPNLRLIRSKSRYFSKFQ